METENVNIKNWKSLIKPTKLDVKMSDDYENSIAFQTACDLVFKGKEQPSGYTEPLLHLNRLKKKSNLSSKSN